MPNPSVSASSRAQEFSSEGFFVNDNKILMCRYCDKRLEYERKDTLLKHIASETHKIGKSKKTSMKRQLSVEGSFLQAKKAKEDKTEFIVETTEAFLSAGISVEKLDHPKMREWLGKYIKGSCDLPSADRIRQHYIPIIGTKKVEELKKIVKHKKLFIMCDETTDKSGNCIFNILFRLLEATDQQGVYLAASAVLDKATGSTCTQSIVDTLNKYAVEYDNVLGIITDSARYMTLCANTLKGLVGEKLAHIQCWAHKINLVGQIWQNTLDELNTTVAKTKAAFLNTRKRKHLYLEFLREKYENDPGKVKHFPMPVQTRWNTWFEAAKYIHEYLDDILEFMEQLGEENSGVKFLKDVSPQFLAVTKIQAQFIADNCNRFVNLITFLEGNSYPTAHVLHSKLKVMENMLDLLTKEVFSTQLTTLLQEMTALSRAEVVKQLKTTAQMSLTKLKILTAEDPSKLVFAAVSKLFDPKTLGNQILSANNAMVELKKLSYATAIESSKFYEGYVVLQGLIKEELKRPECTHVDICKIICSLREEYTEFVKTSLEAIWYPTSNVDSERSISQYGVVVSDRRRRLKPENAEILTMVAFS